MAGREFFDYYKAYCSRHGYYTVGMFYRDCPQCEPRPGMWEEAWEEAHKIREWQEDREAWERACQWAMTPEELVEQARIEWEAKAREGKPIVRARKYLKKIAQKILAGELIPIAILAILLFVGKVLQVVFALVVVFLILGLLRSY